MNNKLEPRGEKNIEEKRKTKKEQRREVREKEKAWEEKTGRKWEANVREIQMNEGKVRWTRK